MRRPLIGPSAHRLFPRSPAGDLAIVAIACAFAVAGCGGRPFAEGSSRELTVITSLPADSPEILLLRAVVEREALRIDHEASYVVRLARPEESRAYRSTNVLVAGFGPFDRIPRSQHGLRDLLERSGEPYAFLRDLWLRGQAVGILWTRSRSEWVPALSRIQNRFYLELDRSTFAAVRERVLSLPRDASAERRLRDELGLTLRVPRGYEVRIDRDASAALLFHPGPPARLLRVRSAGHGPLGDPGAARAALARLFRPHERTLNLPDPLLVPDEMAGAVRQLHGRWEDEEVSAAGPFRYYEVARGSRRYDVDLAVFAPGKPKLPHLRELAALAETLAPR